jgi:RNA polymerase sigma factor (sigma-70 family)
VLEESSNRVLLDAWRGGDDHAVTVLVRRYMARLTSLASSRLSRKLARRVEAEDVVLSAWRSFFVATGRNQVDVPEDDNLWPLLVTMTLRKLSRQAAMHSAERRSIHAEREQQPDSDWPAIAARDPTPAEAALVTDEIEHLMSNLSSTDREILTRRLQGEQHVSIAEAVDCSERTVRRSLQRIRERYLAINEDEVFAPVGPTEPVGARGASSAVGTNHVGEDRRNELPMHRSVEQVPPPSPTAHFSDVVLHELVGQGAFGKVFRATRREDGSIVAVKYLRKSLWKHQPATDQLIREVAVVSALCHPGIIQHFGWGRTGRGAVFAIMEWVDGADLNTWFQSAQPSLADVVRCGIAVCNALSSAHQAGVVHSDLSPQNILRRRDGTFVLTDFGFSRLLSNPESTFLAGTPGFLAPEQLSDAFGTVSVRTDVFGLGGVLYFLLTGKPPVEGQDVAGIFSRTLSSRPIANVGEVVPGIPSGLDSLISRCLRKESVDRPNSIEAVAAALTGFLKEMTSGE